MQQSLRLTVLALIGLLAVTCHSHAETRVLFTARQGSGTNQLYSIGTDGTGLTQHTSVAGDVWAPALGPDNRVAYLSSANANGGDIRIINLDGSGDYWIANGFPALAVQWYDTNMLFYTRSESSDPPYSYQLWQFNTETGVDSTVFTNVFTSWPMGQRSFHIDRTRDKVYLSAFTGSPPKARIFAGTPGMPETLTPLPIQSPLTASSDHYAPAVSPNGTNIAYCADWGGGNHHAYEGKADGSGDATRLMGNYCGSTTWSPSGDSIAFTHASNSTYGMSAYVGNIVLVRLDPSGTNVLTQGTVVEGLAAFPTIYEAASTPSVVSPTVRNEPGSNVVTDSSADIYVSLVSTGDAPTRLFIYHGESDGATNVGSWDTRIDLGTQPPGVYMTTATVSPNRQYWYRAMATNSAGTSWSPESTAYGHATPATLPFSDTFDPRIAGDPTASLLGALDDQNGWRASSPAAATVQGGVAHGGNQSVRLNGGGMTRAFTSTADNVWIETHAKVTPSGHPTDIPPDATAVFCSVGTCARR